MRAELVAYGRKLLGLGLLSQTSGNLSVKTADGNIYITPSSMEYDLIEEDDIVVVGPDGAAATATVPSRRKPRCTALSTRAGRKCRP